MISHARFFGAPLIAAAGDAGAHGVERIDAGTQHAFDGGDEVEDLRVAFELHELRNGDAAVFADLAEVVALEVGDHDELGEFLGVGQELEGELLVTHGIAAARARAFDRARGDVAAANAEEKLGRGGQDFGVTEIEEGTTGCGATGEEVLEEAVGVAIERRGEFLRQIDLVDVAWR